MTSSCWKSTLPSESQSAEWNIYNLVITTVLKKELLGNIVNRIFPLSFFGAPLNIRRTKEEKTKEASVPNGLPVTEISEGYTKVKLEEK